LSQFFGLAASIMVQSTPASEAPTPTDYISTSDNWQTEINNAGTGAVIGINAGTYFGFSVTPLTNQKFVAVGNVVLDGNGAGECFSGHSVRGIEIWGENQMQITDYSPSSFHGAICSLEGDWYDNPPWSEGGWLVDGVEVGPSGGWGGIILTGHDVIIRNFSIHDIGEIGFKVIFGDDGHVHDGEIYNIYPSDWGYEGGGSKNWGTRRLAMEDIYCHDIAGPGLWSDMDNQDTIYRRITCRNVTISNIFHEISGSCIVENCDLEGDPTWVGSNGIWGRSYAAIHIANSGTDAFGGAFDGAIVRNNQIKDFYTGIAYIDQTRTDQYGNSRTNTTEGEAYGNVLDNCDNNGDQMNHPPSAYVPGALPVVWSNNTLLNGSTIN